MSSGALCCQLITRPKVNYVVCILVYISIVLQCQEHMNPQPIL